MQVINNGIKTEQEWSEWAEFERDSQICFNMNGIYWKYVWKECHLLETKIILNKTKTSNYTIFQSQIKNEKTKNNPKLPQDTQTISSFLTA